MFPPIPLPTSKHLQLARKFPPVQGSPPSPPPGSDVPLTSRWQQFKSIPGSGCKVSLHRAGMVSPALGAAHSSCRSATRLLTSQSSSSWPGSRSLQPSPVSSVTASISPHTALSGCQTALLPSPPVRPHCVLCIPTPPGWSHCPSSDQAACWVAFCSRCCHLG